jgi:WD40 repeat protein
VQGLDVAQPGQRGQAVRTTIEASTSLLSQQDVERLTELAVFAEDEDVPFRLVAQLWKATAGLTELETSQVLHRLGELALVALPSAGRTRAVALHDVVRDFLRGELGPGRLTGLHSVLLDVAAVGLPVAGSPGPAEGWVQGVAWWQLDDEDRYLWDHLVEHLIAAGRANEADRVAGDLRWAGARLVRFGPAAPTADLSQSGTPRSTRLQATLIREAHLLSGTSPAEAAMDILHSRVAEDPDWGPQVAALQKVLNRPRLVIRWPLPNQPGVALRRVLTGHNKPVSSVAIAPDGMWLATGGRDGTVQIWETATGAQQTALVGIDGDYSDQLEAVAIAPDGSWLAAGCFNVVRIWDTTTWAPKMNLSAYIGRIHAVAIAPDGTWLAVGGNDGIVRIWDTSTWIQRTDLDGKSGPVNSIAIAPDGARLAAGCGGTVRIWDTATWQLKAAFERLPRRLEEVAIAPDGAWLATADSNQGGAVRIWDAVAGTQVSMLTGHDSKGVEAVAIAPDGTWLASGGGDGTVRIWDAAIGLSQASLAGNDITSMERGVEAVAVAPDGTWFATADSGHALSGRKIRVRETATGKQQRALPGAHVAIAPDGTWLATVEDGMVQIWDTATWKKQAEFHNHADSVTIAPDSAWLATGTSRGTINISRPGTFLDTIRWSGRTVFEGHSGWVTTVVIAPDGAWLASGSSDDGTVRTWGTATGAQLTALTGYEGSAMEPVAVAIAPDSTCLATGTSDGSVQVWDAATWTQRVNIAGHIGRVTTVAISLDGTILASGGIDRTVRIWDAATGHPVTMMRVDSAVRACAWLDTHGLIVGSLAGLYAFDFLAGKASRLPAA